MPIGNVTLSGSPIQYQNPRIPEAAFGAGIGMAIDRLASSTDAYAESKLALEVATKEDQTRQQRFNATTEWTRLQGEMSREQIDAVNSAPADGSGLTNSRLDALRKKQTAFLDTIQDPELRKTFEADTEAFVQNLTTATYGEEYKLRTNFENVQVGKTVESLAGDIANGDSSLEAAQAQLDEVLSSTRLSESERSAIRDVAYANLGAAQFQRDVKTTMSGRGTVREPTGEDVVAAGLTPWERGFLNATAAGESSGSYTVIYGTEEKITDFSDHPRKYAPGPAGPSSAAGRYQITADTWDYLVSKYGKDTLPDFSPENQDRAAILLARERYNSKIGPGEIDFDTILATGTDEQLMQIKKVLAPTWDAFNHMSDDKFRNIFRGVQGVEGGGTGAGNMPDPFTDPRFAAMTYADKVKMTTDAQQAIKSMNEQAEASRQQTADMLKAQFAAGTVGAPEIQNAIASNSVPLKEMDALLGLVKEDLKGSREATRFSSAADSGFILGNTEENQNAAYEYYKRSGVMNGLQQGDVAAANIVATGFAKTGVMPKEVGSMLQSMVNSNDTRQVSYAMDTMSAMRAKNPDMFAFALPKDLVELEGAWAVARRYSPAGNDAKIMEDFNNFRSPQGQQERALYEKDVKKYLSEVTPETLMSEFDGWFSWQPEAPVNPATRGMLKQDFDALYTKYFPLFKDESKTTEFVVEQMGHSWQPDATGGTTRLMYMGPSSPASGYPTVNNSYDWVRQDIIKSMGWAEDEQFSLISDAQSEGDVARGQAASYMITRPTATGWATVMDPENPSQPWRFRPTVTPDTAENERVRQRIELLRGQRDAIISEVGDVSLWSNDTMARYEELGNQIAELEGQQ